MSRMTIAGSGGRGGASGDNNKGGGGEGRKEEGGRRRKGYDGLPAPRRSVFRRTLSEQLWT